MGHDTVFGNGDSHPHAMGAHRPIPRSSHTEIVLGVWIRVGVFDAAHRNAALSRVLNSARNFSSLFWVTVLARISKEPFFFSSQSGHCRSDSRWAQFPCA